MLNDSAALRRHEDNLYVGGLGIIIMGIWNVVRPVMQLTLGSALFVDFGSVEPEIANFAAIATVFIIIAIFLAYLALHIYIGLNAIKAAKRKEHKKGYFVGAIILLIVLGLSMVTYKESLSDLNKIDTTIAALLVDITTIYIFVTVIRSTLKIKELKRKQEQE